MRVVVSIVWLCLLALQCAVSNAQSVEQVRRKIDVHGVEREYLLLVPTSASEAPRALVFNFHGSGGTPERQLATSGFDRVAGEHGFLAVLPQGAYTNSRSSRSWNADLDPAGVDDVALVRAIIEDVRRDYRVDPTQVYSTGFSGGARMTSMLACQLSDELAAVAPVAGIQFSEQCRPSRALPVLTFHGKADRVNHYVPNEDSAPYWVSSVEESVRHWVEADQCNSAMPQERRLTSTVTHRVWDGCANGANVEFYLIDDGGHTWPGSALVASSERSGATNQELDASELIWQFFSRHRLAAPD